MRIRNKPDFWAGIMFIGIGLGFALGATKYSMGTAARMGPGYFPFWLGICLAIMGVVVALSGVSKKAVKEEIAKFDWKIFFIIIGAVVLCGAVFSFLGVYVSVFLLVMISSLASHEYNWKIALATSVFLLLVVWLAFIEGLGLIFPLWPQFIS